MGSPAYAEKRPKAAEDQDRELVVRARDGEADAFEAIVRRYQRRVYGVALRMLRRHELADDVTQETFVRAYRHLQRFELGRPLAPWLTRIAVNLSIDHLNGPGKRERSLKDQDEPSTEPMAQGASDPLTCLLSKEFTGALAGAVEELPAEQRAVFVLKVHEEMRYEDIATTLGISPGTVMSRLFRARARLKERLRDYL